MRILIAPDSFKGTMTSSEVCRVVATEIKELRPDAEVVCLPVADGGEGSVDAFAAALGERAQIVTVKGTDSFGCVRHDMKICVFGKTAVIETAQSVGLQPNRLDIMNSTTYGVGALIKAALDAGCRKLIFCLGGSGTNDMGAGAACAMGAKFYDRNGCELIPKSGGLSGIGSVDLSGLDARLRESEIIGACDVTNPLYGNHGAAAVYGSQKGADEELIKVLDAGVRRLSDIVENEVERSVAYTPGAGAAGGFGAGIMLFFGGKLASGADTVLDAVGFDEAARNADVIITGEGCADAQSVSGKIVCRVAERSRGKEVVCLCGKIGDGAEKLLEHGVSRLVCITPEEQTREEAKTHCFENLRNAVRSDILDI